MVKAVANVSDRHIINVNLSNVKTKTQLHSLFYDEEIRVAPDASHGPGNDDVYTIPINKRLYVLEDIDCIGNDVVVDRDIKHTEEVAAEAENFVQAAFQPPFSYFSRPSPHAYPHVPSSSPEWGCENVGYGRRQPRRAPNPSNHGKDIHDALDLSTILNVLDGTLESPGRMVIMTSNNPKRLDKALVRKGRVDLCLEFVRASTIIIYNMFMAFYDIGWPAGVGVPKGGCRTPAEVSAILFDNFDTPSMAAAELVK